MGIQANAGTEHSDLECYGLGVKTETARNHDHSFKGKEGSMTSHESLLVLPGSLTQVLVTGSCLPSRNPEDHGHHRFGTCRVQNRLPRLRPATPLSPPTTQQRVVPVCDNAVLNGILQGQDTSLRLCLGGRSSGKGNTHSKHM